MIAPNKARPIGRAFFAYWGIDFAALRRDARCCLPREWSHFKAICAAGEPEGARPASDGIGQYLFSKKINKKIDHRGATDALSLMAPEPQGSPRGQGPPRMGSGSIFMQSIKILPLAEMGPEADPLLREGGKTRRTGWRRMEGSCLDGGNGILRRREESSWIRMRRSCRQSGSQA